MSHARWFGRSPVVLCEHLGRAAGRADPDRAIVIGKERVRGRVVAGGAITLVEVSDAVRGHDVYTGTGADPQPALVILANVVHHARDPVGRCDVLELRDAAGDAAEAGPADR